MLTLLCIVLLTSHVLSADQSLKCNERTEYAENQQCCKKCKPGQFMDEKCGTSSRDTQCKPCGNGFFTNEYNIKYKYCSPCTKCTKEHMRYKRTCTTIRDAECTCEDGYRCSDNKCETCVKVQKTTPPTKIPPVTNGMPSDNHLTIAYNCHDSKCQMNVHKTTASPPATNDNAWISVSLCLACVCVCFLFTCLLLTSRHAQPCGWIMSASTGFWYYTKSNSLSSQCTEEEKVPMPVQEMCGKTEKLEDV